MLEVRSRLQSSSYKSVIEGSGQNCSPPSALPRLDEAVAAVVVRRPKQPERPVKKTPTKTVARRPAKRGRSRSRARKTPPLAPAAQPASEVVLESGPEPSYLPQGTPVLEPEIVVAEPEREFATRAVPPEPERPFPVGRRAIFFDVENTSRAEHIAKVIDHLAVDRFGRRTDFVAVGNWKVIGQDTARLLARHGAQLLHSAPSTGVRDWSDLRIAVGAGVWLASARPGDIIEIVTNDRAFDAVGDVAASLGIAFRRLSYQGLVGATAGPEPTPEPVRPSATDSRGRHRRRGRHRGWHEAVRGTPTVAPSVVVPSVVAPTVSAPPAVPVVAELPLSSASGNGTEPASGEPHTAPHDEIIAVVRDLIHRAPARSVTIDTLANALKTRGFSRPPGSPRLITRLRRIKEISVNRTGTITLVEPSPADAHVETGPTEARAETPVSTEEAAPAAPSTIVAPQGEADDDFDPADSIGNLKDSPLTPPVPPNRPRWPRRGGRHRRPNTRRAPAA